MKRRGFFKTVGATLAGLLGLSTQSKAVTRQKYQQAARDELNRFCAEQAEKSLMEALSDLK